MRYCVLLLVVGLACSAFAQQPAVQPTAQPAAGQLDAQELITREYGKSFTVIPAIAPVVGDLDGDGQEDAAIVVASTTPLVDEVEFKYKAIDPYDSFWGC